MRIYTTELGRIRKYNNGSYAYWSVEKKSWANIPAELAKRIINQSKNHQQ